MFIVSEAMGLIITLQKKYLEKLAYHFPFERIDFVIDFFDVSENCAVFSSYCISELSPETRNLYFDNMFSKAAHGYIWWNINPVEKIRIKREHPFTGSPNNVEVSF